MTAPPLPTVLRTRFELRGLLGQGAFGAVHRAWDRELEREVAVKVLLPDPEPTAGARFEREASLLSSLRHPGIVEVYDFGDSPEGRYLVMELLRGRTFADDPPPDSLAAVLAVAEALEEVHRAGALHRDIKPANLMRTDSGRVVLLDFGLARQADDAAMTDTGAVVGTLAFLGPEVWTGGEVGPACDWYALGATLFVLLEGRLPRSPGAPTGSLVFRATPAADPVRALLAGLLDPDPGRRIQGVRAMRRALATRPTEPAAETAALPTGLPAVPSRTSGTRPPRNRLLRAGATVASLGVFGALLAAFAPTRSPPDPAPSRRLPPAAHAEADRALADLLRSLEGLTETHRRADGTFRYARKDGTTADHLRQVVEEFADTRTPLRWRRLLRDLRGWVATANPEQVEELLAEEILPGILHLLDDYSLLWAYRSIPGTFGVTDPDILEQRLASLEHLDAQEADLAAILNNGSRELVPWYAIDAVLVLAGRLLVFGDEASLARLNRELLGRIEATRDLGRRGWLLQGMVHLGTESKDRTAFLSCEVRERQISALAGVVRDRRAADALPAGRFASAAALLPTRRLLYLQACRKAITAEDLEAIDADLDALEVAAMARPVPAAVALEGMLTAYRIAGQLTWDFGPAFERRMARLEAIATRLDTELRGEPRGWPLGDPPGFLGHILTSK